MSVPDFFAAPTVNTALLPSGSPEKSAVSASIASPSGSLAVMFTVRTWLSFPLTDAGAVTTGARSAGPVGAAILRVALVVSVAPRSSVTVILRTQLPAL